MAPDQAFAAQMWLWPDATIKRDASGAILFVNAAFLALYGGRVEDWHGMGLSGWANPPAPNTSQRFETRISGAVGEQVFDWIESAGADGSALAIARDVSVLLTPPGGEPQVQAQDVEDDFRAPPLDTSIDTSVSQPATPDAPQFETVMAAPETELAPPPVSQAEIAPTAPDLPPVTEAVPASEVDAPSADNRSDFDTSGFDDLALEPPAEPLVTRESASEAPQAAPEAPVETAELSAEAASEVAPQREFERRALPVEDTSAVLGNNWRDAVIAKAVGAGEDTPADPAPAPSSTPTSDAGDSGDIRILLAEDNAINALLTRTLLEAEGCIVDTVEDGALAVEAMRAKRYDLIFMDMRMPNMDGLDATRKIRSMDHASKGLPIIALTANAFDDDRNACFDAGMNDFMTKPVSAEELSEMVTRWTSESAELKATA